MNSHGQQDCVLLIENDPADASVIREILATGPIEMEWGNTQSSAFDKARRDGVFY